MNEFILNGQRGGREWHALLRGDNKEKSESGWAERRRSVCD